MEPNELDTLQQKFIEATRTVPRTPLETILAALFTEQITAITNPLEKNTALKKMDVRVYLNEYLLLMELCAVQPNHGYSPVQANDLQTIKDQENMLKDLTALGLAQVSDFDALTITTTIFSPKKTAQKIVAEYQLPVSKTALWDAYTLTARGKESLEEHARYGGTSPHQFREQNLIFY